MMDINPRLRDGLLIVGITLVALYILVPRSKGISHPKVADEKDVTQVQNARIILDAYLNAVENNEPKTELDKLNQIFIKEYKMKVVQNKDGKYVARTTSGADVLMVK